MRFAGSKQAIWWGAVALVLALVLWLLGAAIMPFVLGMAIAYLLDPVVDRLERAGVSRVLAVVLITGLAVLALATALVWLVPLLIRQGTQLVETTPAMIDRLQAVVQSRYPHLFPDGGFVDNALQQARTTVASSMGTIVGTVMGSINGVIGFVMVLVIAPVVAFYMLLDWDRMVRRIDALLPRPHLDTLRGLARQIDDSISGFVRGQAVVILILAVFYSVGLALAGLPFGIVIGVSAASLSFIPYVGTLVGGVISIGVALFTFWGEPERIIAVAGIFVAGQMLEGNYLQPKIVGGHVGLHPVWLMLALSVFGTLFGFVGLLVAVPLGAAVGVIVRYSVDRYKVSPLYTGAEAPAPVPTPTLVELAPRGTVARRVASAQRSHDAAVREARIESARDEAHIAAVEAAESDGARVAVAEVEVKWPDAPPALGTGQPHARVKTWGGRTPDGTDPADPEERNAPRTAAEIIEDGRKV
ncbi:AI-2E family transporter [Paracoccus salipaludis]|uniref:AI-2E family transporter n=1 Tax=Paracoccus salipaludis TaxID=2032623 RepID=UPI00197DD294|nr:AI-2E family transporter [Paracoccus salipaludis]